MDLLIYSVLKKTRVRLIYNVRSHEKQKAIDKLFYAFHPKRQKGE
jgi:hypothetical protein